MSTNRAAVPHGVGDLRIESRPPPEPGPREVVVEVSSVACAVAVGACQSGIAC